MEKALIDSADGRLINRMTLLHMTVTKQKYDDSWDDTVEYLKSFRERNRKDA